MFGLFKKTKSEYAKGQAISCLKGYLKKSAMETYADIEVFEAIEVYSNNLVDMNVQLFSTDKPQYNVYIVSWGILWKTLNDEYLFDRINQLEKVIAHAVLLLGTEIENNVKLKNSFSEFDAAMFVALSKDMISKKHKLIGSDSSIDEIEETLGSNDKVKSTSKTLQGLYDTLGVDEEYFTSRGI